MKKLMFAAAVAAAGLAFGIESANIVGYKDTAAITGISQKSSAFDGVSTAATDIQNIIPKVGEGEDIYSGGFVIMTLTDGGETDESFTFILAADAPDGGTDGWFDDAGERAVKTFLPGEGFVLVSDFATGTLTTAGAVANEDTVFALSTGINSCGNTTAGQIGINQLTVGVDVDASGNLLASNDTTGEAIYSGGIVAMMLTDGGETDESFTFILAADAPDGGTDGWFDDAGDRSTKPFAAGEGFIIVTDYNESYIKLPSAL